jgi:PAS domain S-box-containing protein
MKPTQFFRPAGLLILALRVLSVALMGLLLWELFGTDGVKTIHMVQMLLFFGLLALVLWHLRQDTGYHTERQRDAESAVTKAEGQRRILELCIAKLDEAVVITQIEPFEAPHPRIVFVNDAFERITGYSRSEVLGKSPSLLQGEKTQHSELERMRQGVSQWQPVHVELIAYKKNGQEYWVEIDIVQVASDMGWFRISVQRDISARKAAEADMLAMIGRAQEASRLKSEFMTSISHEMRTPMNGVIGMAQVLQGTPLDDQQQTYLGYIVSSAQDYMHVINQALDFSKLDSGQLVIDNLPFEFQPMLDALEAAIRSKAEAKKLTLQMKPAADLPRKLLGDVQRLHQCVLALLDNAVKFTAKGGVVLDVKAVQWAGQVPALRFAVTDSGIGLSEADRACLFHPFVQVDGSISRRYGGIGLGLIICQQLVALMQGRMGVQSTPGEGSTFWFELPLRATP